MTGTERTEATDVILVVGTVQWELALGLSLDQAPGDYELQRDRLSLNMTESRDTCGGKGDRLPAKPGGRRRVDPAPVQVLSLCKD